MTRVTRDRAAAPESFVMRAYRNVALAAGAFGLLSIAVGAPRAEPAQPEPDPPVLETEGPAEPSGPAPRGAANELIEWTMHRSADGQHPNGVEQAFIWLMNRARHDPSAEGAFLRTVDDPLVDRARSFFRVDLGLLQDEFDAFDPAPPSAFDARLYEAARAHSLDLIDRDAQDHAGQFARVDAAGFHYRGGRGSVFSYTKTALYGHAAFNIDWGGNDGTGMQNPPGHRLAIMLDYPNVGLAAVSTGGAALDVGPLVVTANYMVADARRADHHNRFLVGTVWEDLDHNERFDPGEGLEGVEVLPDRGPYYAVTSAGGGFAVPALSEGLYRITFSGSALGAPRNRTAFVGQESVLVDLRLPEPGAGASTVAALLVLGLLATRRRAPHTASSTARSAGSADLAACSRCVP